MTEHDLVQPILVLKERDQSPTHAETILCGARASLGAFVLPLKLGRETPPAWDTWLSGRFTKSVRRASEKTITKAIDWARQNDVDWAMFASGDSAAVAFPPMTYEDYPKVIRGAQVAGTDMVHVGTLAGGEGALSVHVRGGLTTGKATAQAAHALWMWALPQLTDDPERIHDWAARRHMQMQVVTEVAADELQVLATDPGTHAVVDAGLTEVDPNTLTAVAVSA